MREPIRVICVDDSHLVRDILTTVINEQADMEVIETAADPLIARDMIKQHNPDVITLDVEMPRMDGLDFLERLMRLRPMPVVMISSLTMKGSEITLKALELGAVDFVAKPAQGIREGLEGYAEEIANKIRAAYLARHRISLRSANHLPQEGQKPKQPEKVPFLSSEKIIAIGASTGGTTAIKDVLMPLPANFPAIVMAQHMPEGFTKAFAERLDSLCKITVKEAEEGERILPGHAYLAPGHSHLKIERSGANYIARLDNSGPVNRHMPSVGVLYDSVSSNVGRNAIGVLLTGMGKDGAEGLLNMRKSGAVTICQDEPTCIVFGMPKEGIKLGAAQEVLPLHNIAHRLVNLVASSGRAQRV